MTKIVGLWSGHDTSFCVLNDGVPEIHSELERHDRVKEQFGDSIDMYFKQYDDFNNVGISTTCHLGKGIAEHKKSFDKLTSITGQPIVVGHHAAHAAHAFYSSNFRNALVVTIDSGGIENELGYCPAFTIWKGEDHKLSVIDMISADNLNIGSIWTRVTRFVFGLESGWPQGHQAGTVMAMAAFGNPDNAIQFEDDIIKMFSTDMHKVLYKPEGHIRGMSARDIRVPRHPYLCKYKDIVDVSEQARFDFALAFQTITEKFVFSILSRYLNNYTNLCVAGGVALNSVLIGKLKSIFPKLKEIFVPPVPYDAGLTIGAAQFTWHNIMGNPRIQWEGSLNPYLGCVYSNDHIDSAINNCDKIQRRIVTDDDVVDLLINEKIVSVFHGRAESGRRALGNRSILADARSHNMKAMINDKVKHRQWFRPFAPSILVEKVDDWFLNPCESPFMSFVLKFKPEAIEKVPAVVHQDASARLQTVHKETNPWYHSFISKFEAKTGVPILLNTSFNDREPIVETPEHAINCFLSTEIDYLYFVDTNSLISKK